MRLNEFFAVGLFGVAEAIQRVYHRPASDHIRKTSIDLSMVWQRQRRISCMPQSRRTQHDLMAAAGIPERSYSGRSVELGRVRLEPANSQVHITDRSGIARLRWLAEIDSSHQDAPSRQRLIDTGIIRPVAVVPCAAVHVDDARKWAGSFRLINANQPGLACQGLIFDIPHVYLEFAVGFHAGNLLPRALIRKSSRLRDTGARVMLK